MSVKIMGMVWDADIPRALKFVLLAYADHADHDGGNVYPSYDLIARKTGYDRRQVIRITAILEKERYMTRVRDDAGRDRSRHSTVMWKINPENFPQFSRPFIETVQSVPQPPPIYASDILSLGGDKMSLAGQKGVTKCHPPSDILSPGGDIYDTKMLKMSPEPSINQSVKPSENRQDDVSGEPPIYAHLPDGTVETVVPGSTMTPGGAWAAAMQQLRLEMPKAAFDSFVKGARCVSFNGDTNTMIVEAPSAYAKDWMQSRLSSTIIRLVTGMLNRHVSINLTSPE